MKKNWQSIFVVLGLAMLLALFAYWGKQLKEDLSDQKKTIDRAVAELDVRKRIIRDLDARVWIAELELRSISVSVDPVPVIKLYNRWRENSGRELTGSVNYASYYKTAETKSGN